MLPIPTFYSLNPFGYIAANIRLDPVTGKHHAVSPGDPKGWIYPFACRPQVLPEELAAALMQEPQEEPNQAPESEQKDMSGSMTATSKPSVAVTCTDGDATIVTAKFPGEVDLILQHGVHVGRVSGNVVIVIEGDKADLIGVQDDNPDYPPGERSVVVRITIDDGTVLYSENLSRNALQAMDNGSGRFSELIAGIFQAANDLK